MRATISACVVLAAALAFPGSASGAGATYTVLKCHANSPGVSEVGSYGGGSYALRNRCGAPERQLEVTNTGFAGSGASAGWYFVAPAGTSIVRVDVRANLRRDNNHHALLVAVDDASQATVLARGGDTGDGYQGHSFGGLNHRTFRMELKCTEPSGCNASNVAHAYMQNIELVLADWQDPKVKEVGGELLDEGWQRGAGGIRANGSDMGSGVVRVTSTVNNTFVGGAFGVCSGALGTPYSSALIPCPIEPGIAGLDETLNTALSPFVNGANAVRLCAEDFAGNLSACYSTTVYVDNDPPALAFSSQDPSDPELVQAHFSEQHSGLAEGSIAIRSVGSEKWQGLDTEIASERLRARVDSDAFPPGRYEFRVTASDVAGNQNESTSRVDGTPMILEFPLRSQPRLTGGLEPGNSERLVVPYGRDARAAGRMQGPDGAPLSDAEITVTEDFGPGALLQERVRTVLTDDEGRWQATFPAGPSRRVEASFAGSRRFQPARTEIGEIEVRSGVTFRPSRTRVPEGKRVVFAGRIGHVGARVPAPGKLVEVQVRNEGQGWNTVNEAFHTRPSGRYRFGYRFGRFYAANAVFRFRLKVTREHGWPYRAPAASRIRRVVVVARD